MRAVDLIKISSISMELLSKIGIKTSDWKYLGMWNEYEELVRHGEKIGYIVAHLAGKYKVSETSVYRVLRRFKRAVNI